MWQGWKYERGTKTTEARTSRDVSPPIFYVSKKSSSRKGCSEVRVCYLFYWVVVIDLIIDNDETRNCYLLLRMPFDILVNTKE